MSQPHGQEPSSSPDERRVPAWDGRLSRRLREAMRLSVREFARQLGVTHRMVSKWEQAGEAIRPRPFSQRLLDTMLSRATPHARAGFFAPTGPTSDLAAPPQLPWNNNVPTSDVGYQRQLIFDAMEVVGTHHILPGAVCAVCRCRWPCTSLQWASRIIVAACGDWAR